MAGIQPSTLAAVPPAPPVPTDGCFHPTSGNPGELWTSSSTRPIVAARRTPPQSVPARASRQQHPSQARWARSRSRPAGDSGDGTSSPPATESNRLLAALSSRARAAASPERVGHAPAWASGLSATRTDYRCVFPANRRFLDGARNDGRWWHRSRHHRTRRRRRGKRARRCHVNVDALHRSDSRPSLAHARARTTCGRRPVASRRPQENGWERHPVGPAAAICAGVVRASHTDRRVQPAPRAGAALRALAVDDARPGGRRRARVDAGVSVLHARRPARRV